MPSNYNINYSKPGKVFVFANGFFNGNLTDLENIYKDIESVEETFGGLNYEIITFSEIFSQEITNELKNIRENFNFENDSCVIVFIDSHGDLDKIYGNDGKVVYIRQFFDVFKLNKTLKNKPKLFFIDACRGNNKMKSKNAIYNDVTEKKVNEEADVFIGYATTEDCVAYLDASGSKYIQAICKLVEKKDENEEIDHILREVNNLLSNEKNQTKQVSNVSHSLRKKFFFKKDQNLSSLNKRWNSAEMEAIRIKYGLRPSYYND